jgi:Ala-tRNA(Pro) deacylase
MTLTSDLRHQLDREQLDYDLIEHRRTERASDEAKAIGVPPEEVAKTIVLATDDRYVRAVIPASENLDLHKVRQLLVDKHARLASEAELVLAYPMYELGAVPPFGIPAGDRVLFDRRLAQHDSVVLEAGSHNKSLRMKTADLLTLTGAQVEDIAANGSGGEHPQTEGGDQRVKSFGEEARWQRTFRPPVKRLDRLLARADLLATWARVQAYLSGSSGRR